MVPAWVSDWVGIPYVDGGRSRDGLDCLGLFLALHHARHDRVIPDITHPRGVVIRGGLDRALRGMFNLVPAARQGDALIIRRNGFPLHVGYCIDGVNMLHAVPDEGTVVDAWNSSRWRNRVMGVYRHVDDC